MVYRDCTYDFIPPYLKSIHISLEVWRPNNYVDGYKCEEYPDPMFAAEIEKKGYIPNRLLPNIHEEPPETVQLVDHVLIDMQALNTFLNLLSPIMVIIRPIMGRLCLAYDFSDESGEGCGGQLAPTYLLSSIEIYFWCTEDLEKSFKNCEIKNCYNFLNQEAESLQLIVRKV